MRKPTALEVKQLQRKMRISILEAKLILERDYLRQALAEAKTVEDLKPIIGKLI